MSRRKYRNTVPWVLLFCASMPAWSSGGLGFLNLLSVFNPAVLPLLVQPQEPPSQALPERQHACERTVPINSEERNHFERDTFPQSVATATKPDAEGKLERRERHVRFNEALNRCYEIEARRPRFNGFEHFIRRRPAQIERTFTSRNLIFPKRN